MMVAKVATGSNYEIFQLLNRFAGPALIVVELWVYSFCLGVNSFSQSFPCPFCPE